MNIALVKYWGKRRDVEELMIPLNDSISVSIDRLRAITTVYVYTSSSIDDNDDSVTINGCRIVENRSRFNRFFAVTRSRKSIQWQRFILKEVRRILNSRDDIENIHRHFKVQRRDEYWQLIAYYCQIVSTTNFPVSAGLASSAAGFAALAFAFAHLFNIDERTMTRLARIGIPLFEWDTLLLQDISRIGQCVS